MISIFRSILTKVLRLKRLVLASFIQENYCAKSTLKFSNQYQRFGFESEGDFGSLKNLGKFCEVE